MGINKSKVIKVVVVLLLSLALIFSIFCYYLYTSFGYKEYLDALKAVNSIENEQERQSAFEKLFENPEGGYSAGILGYSDSKGRFIFLWEKSGPRIVKLNSNVEFSYYEACTDENIVQFNNGEAFTIFRRIFDNYSEWYSKAQKGDYVSLVNNETGSISELKVSDSWLFLPIDLNKICTGTL